MEKERYEVKVPIAGTSNYERLSMKLKKEKKKKMQLQGDGNEPLFMSF